MKACQNIKKTKFEWEDGVPILPPGMEKKNGIEKIYMLAENIGQDYWQELKKIVCNNFWIEYFQNKRTEIEGKWLDFEEEIKDVVVCADTKMLVPSGGLPEADERRRKDIESVLRRCNISTSGFAPKKIIKSLHEQHIKMVRAFEMYIDGYINKCQCEKIDLFTRIRFDHVLSFNYSSTYTELYDPSVECCYVHGKADLSRDITQNNMVIGIDNAYEDYPDVGKEVLPFEKYVQRIVKRTGNRYFKWLDGVGIERIKVHIFGHSFANTDGDVMRRFIENDRVDTIIHYRDDEDRAEKIYNLAVILKKQGLVSRTGGETNSIDFVDIRRPLRF